jgi:hypothetical protein
MIEESEVKVTETSVLEKFEGDELVERITIVDGTIVDRETFGKDE